jgi:hypothetical protein
MHECNQPQAGRMDRDLLRHGAEREPVDDHHAVVGDAGEHALGVDPAGRSGNGKLSASL